MQVLETSIFLVAIVAMIALLGAVLAFALNTHSLLSYLKKNQYARWAELTSSEGCPPNGRLTAQFFKYLWSITDDQDATVLDHKKKLRLLIMLALLCSAVYLISFVVGLVTT